MYEENNSQDKPVVIGIDHEFSLMQTKHHIFSNGILRCNGRPPVVENSIYYDGSYYCIGGERKTVHEDKTADEDFFLLTLVAVAKEIKTRGLPSTLQVVLGVGVPFKRFGREQAKLVAYLKRSGPHFIEFEAEDYVITIEDVYCFPQCFAAIVDRIGNMHAEFVRGAEGILNNDEFGNNNQVEHIADQKAKVVLQEMHGKDFSEYGFRDACIKAGTQLQNADKDRSYERGVRIR